MGNLLSPRWVIVEFLYFACLGLLTARNLKVKQINCQGNGVLEVQLVWCKEETIFQIFGRRQLRGDSYLHNWVNHVNTFTDNEVETTPAIHQEAKDR